MVRLNARTAKYLTGIAAVLFSVTGRHLLRSHFYDESSDPPVPESQSTMKSTTLLAKRTLRKAVQDQVLRKNGRSPRLHR